MLYLLYSCLRKVLFVYPAGLFFWETIPPDQELLFSLLQAKKLGREAPPKQDSDLWVGLGLRMPAHFNLLCQMPLSVSSFSAKSPSQRGSSLQAALPRVRASGVCVSELDVTASPTRPQYWRDAATDSTLVSSALERNV